MGDPFTVRSKVNKDEHFLGAGSGGPCTGKAGGIPCMISSNVSWVMVTWDSASE